MTKTIRRVSFVMLLLFGALIVNLNVTQMLRAGELVDHPNNRRLLVAEYAIERGEIVVGEEAIARSIETDDDLEYLRVYTDPELWAHVTGYDSFVISRTGIERAFNEELLGTRTEFLAQNLAQLFGDGPQVGNTVRLTLIPGAQRAARDGLGNRAGAVVAINPRTGAVLAHYSSPSYDPNPLSSHDGGAILDTWSKLTQDPANPLLDRAVQENYPPGSTFKLIVAAAALEQGLLPNTAFTNRDVYDVPGTTADIANFSPGRCGDEAETITMTDALRVSCNTVFAELGVNLGPDVILEQAQRFGFNRTPPHDLPVVRSRFPQLADNQVPELAQSSIGERDVRATALQQALTVAAIVNDGRLPRPHLVRDVLDPGGRVVQGAREGLWAEGTYRAEAVSPQTANLLRSMMVTVVESGTGTRAQIEGVQVGGKTGTASVPDRTPTVWFVGFAGDQVAVAVVVPDAGDGATGGRIAAPIARAVMEAVLAAQS
ncbi:MAG: penicillin-binding protein 2 [Nitriliruptorales bacterium]|nr:penicillin-binding protein 2 [Nitriliruptorales bacterium]